ncbi:MAG: 4Fe-4S binding protein [bacterium]
MAMKITEECSSCGACVDECENEAISEGDPIYVIDPEKCTECKGIADSPKCLAACPLECIVKAE